MAEEIIFTADTLKNTKKYQQIYNALKDELKKQCVDNPVFLDLIEDYMTLWITKELLRVDIEKTGVKIQYNNGGGQSGYKENPSIEKFHKANSQMLKLLSELGFKTSVVSNELVNEL